MSAKAWESRRFRLWYLGDRYPHIPFCHYLRHEHLGNTSRIISAKCRKLQRIAKKRKQRRG